MIRTDYDICNEDYDKISIPFDSTINKYIKDNLLDDFIAFYIAKGYQMDALFKGSLEGVFIGAVDSLCNIKFGSAEDISRIKTILRDKYNLLLTSDTELEIEEIVKEEQH